MHLCGTFASPGSSTLARRFQVDEALGLPLPRAHELLDLVAVVEGLLKQAGVLRRDHAVQECASVHVPPLVVRGIPGRSGARKSGCLAIS